MTEKYYLCEPFALLVIVSPFPRYHSERSEESPRLLRPDKSGLAMTEGVSLPQRSSNAEIQMPRLPARRMTPAGERLRQASRALACLRQSFSEGKRAG